MGLGGEVHEDEIGGGVEIVGAGFVDDTEIAFLGGLVVGNDQVDLTLLQIGAVLVLDAEGELCIGIRLGHGSIQKSLDLHLLAADTVGFVPMKLGTTYVSAFGSDRGDAFELAPPAGTELASETHDIVDIATYGNHFDIVYLPYKLKVHSGYPNERLRLRLPRVIVRSGQSPFNPHRASVAGELQACGPAGSYLVVRISPFVGKGFGAFLAAARLGLVAILNRLSLVSDGAAISPVALGALEEQRRTITEVARSGPRYCGRGAPCDWVPAPDRVEGGLCAGMTALRRW